MIDFELTDEQKLIRDTAREFADNEIPPRARDSDRAERFDHELVAKMAHLGFIGPILPEEYGGRGLDYRTYGLIVEEIGRVDSSARTVISVCTSLFGSAPAGWGSEEQQQRILPGLTDGSGLGCFGLTEPDSGSDAASLKTRAEKTWDTEAARALVLKAGWLKIQGRPNTLETSTAKLFASKAAIRAANAAIQVHGRDDRHERDDP